LGDDYIISAFELDQKIEKAQGKDASTLRQWERAHGITKQGDLWTKEGALVVVGNNELKRGGDFPLSRHYHGWTPWNHENIGFDPAILLVAEHEKTTQPSTLKDAPPVKCPKLTRTPANQHCHLSPRNPTHYPSRLSPWISLSNSLSQRDLT